MLWALALLGILPAAFIFNEDESEADDEQGANDVSDQNEEAVSQENIGPDVFDIAFGQAEEGTLEDSQASHHELVSNGAETLFENFDTDEDKITLHLTDDGSGEFISETLQDNTGEPIGVSLSYVSEGVETTLNFLGITTMPEDNIEIGITSQDTGEEELYGLSELADFHALDPNDPEDPAIPTPDDGSNGPIIAPNDPEDPAVPNGSEDPDGPVLTPNSPDDDGQIFTYNMAEGDEALVLNNDPFEGGSDASIVTSGNTVSIETDYPLHQVQGSDAADTIVLGDHAAIVQAGDGNDTIFAGEGTAIVDAGAGDDTIYGGSDLGSEYLLSGGAGDDQLVGGDAAEALIGGAGTDALSGGAGDDTLLIDTQDTAEGGAGDDTFWITSIEGSGTNFAEITDFSQGEDIVRISLPAEAEQSGNFDIDVSPTDDGLAAQVTVNGDVVAVLHGAPNATASDVILDFTA